MHKSLNKKLETARNAATENNTNRMKPISRKPAVVQGPDFQNLLRKMTKLTKILGKSYEKLKKNLQSQLSYLKLAISKHKHK